MVFLSILNDLQNTGLPCPTPGIYFQKINYFYKIHKLMTFLSVTLYLYVAGKIHVYKQIHDTTYTPFT